MPFSSPVLHSGAVSVRPGSALPPSITELSAASRSRVRLAPRRLRPGGAAPGPRGAGAGRRRRQSEEPLALGVEARLAPRVGFSLAGQPPPQALPLAVSPPGSTSRFPLRSLGN